MPPYWITPSSHLVVGLAPTRASARQFDVQWHTPTKANEKLLTLAIPEGFKKFTPPTQFQSVRKNLGRQWGLLEAIWGGSNVSLFGRLRRRREQDAQVAPDKEEVDSDYAAYARENHETLSPFSSESRTLVDGDSTNKGILPPTMRP